MKTFSSFIKESCVTSDVNPGNQLLRTGVSNHYIPIENILINVKNLYAVHAGIVASVADDGVSIKLQSSKFVTPDAVDRVLMEPFANSVYSRDASLYTYLVSQGLDKKTLVNVGQFWVVYFSPSDIACANPGQEDCGPACEDLEVVVTSSVITESDDDEEEVTNATDKEIHDILTSKDRTKAAKNLEAIVAKRMSLPRDFYFAHVKNKEGDESIALRWKYMKKMHGGIITELTRSILNIYGEGDDAVWVGDFDKDSIINLPDEVKKLIESVLDILSAEETSDPCVFSIEEFKEKEDSNGEDDSHSDDESPNNEDEKE